MAPSYWRPCRYCGQRINMRQVGPRWRALDPDGTPHRCAFAARPAPRSYRRAATSPLLVLAALLLAVAGVLYLSTNAGQEAPPDQGPAQHVPAPAASGPAAAGQPPPAQPQQPDRRDCAAVRGSEYRSDAEREWYRANCLLAPGVPAGAQAARVVGVVDGDTIDVLLNGSRVRVRYFGVNTPERGQRCYAEATQRNRALVGETVYLLPDARETDQYGRLLRYAFTPAGVMVDATLVAEGYGWAWTRDGAYRQQIMGLEAQARQDRTGCLWRTGRGTSPLRPGEARAA